MSLRKNIADSSSNYHIEYKRQISALIHSLSRQKKIQSTAVQDLERAPCGEFSILEVFRGSFEGTWVSKK